MLKSIGVLTLVKCTYLFAFSYRNERNKDRYINYKIYGLRKKSYCFF